MTAKSRHPGIDEWQSYLGGAVDDDALETMQRHLDACSGCRRQLEVLRLLESGEALTPDLGGRSTTQAVGDVVAQMVS